VRRLEGMTGSRGFSLIEVVVVVAIIAIALGMAGPRIGAGIGNLELTSAEKMIQSLVKVGKVQAERLDREHYVVVSQPRHSVSLLGPNLEVLREESLPSSVNLVADPAAVISTVYIGPSGGIRTAGIRLEGRSGEREVVLR
jgi:prepilin-type N-terminal cleavage/methylation domain-containing protein